MWYRSLLPRKWSVVWPLLLLLLTGCAGVSPSGGGEPLVSPLPALLYEEVVLYFPHASEPVLVQERRRVVRKGIQPELLVLQELVRGPNVADARPVVDLDPDTVGFGFMGAKVFGGRVGLIVTEVVAEALRRAGEVGVYAVVNSLAELERVTEVSFTVQGNNSSAYMVETLDITMPMAPRWDLVSQPESE